MYIIFFNLYFVYIIKILTNRYLIDKIIINNLSRRISGLLMIELIYLLLRSLYLENLLDIFCNSFTFNYFEAFLDVLR